MQVAFDKRVPMQFIMTPKMHVLLAHAVDLLNFREGLGLIGESRIERVYQTQHKYNIITSSCGNALLRNDIKQKRQCIRNNIEIKEVTERVVANSKRKKQGEITI